MVTKSQLFAHNYTQEVLQRIDPFAGGTGVPGRMCDPLNKKNFNAKPITIQSAHVAAIGVPGNALHPMVISSKGAAELHPSPWRDDFKPDSVLAELNSGTELHSSLFGETLSSRLQQSLYANDVLVKALKTTTSTQTFSGSYSANSLHLMKYAVQIEISFSLSWVDGITMQLKQSLDENFESMNTALSDLTAEMKSQGYWDDVTVMIASEFGRTLTGEGSDHAWGGNSFVMGGSVKEGVINGDYPADITNDSPLSIGRGRSIPTLSWESILNSVVEWMGLDKKDELDCCLPTRKETGMKLFTEKEVFKK